MIRLAINGFGRIGRLVLRRVLEDKDVFDVAAVNTSGRMSVEGWAHLFKYDSVYGRYAGEVKISGEYLLINGRKILCLGQRDPSELPWRELGVDVVVEATGVFKTSELAGKHLSAGAGKVVISAPVKDKLIKTFIVGVNDDRYKSERIVSCASCTTNCVAVIVKILEDNFGIESGFLTTVHAYTSTQRLQDNSHKDWRRARAAAMNIIPTSTGATKATVMVIPELEGAFEGVAVRVPVPVGSLSDLVFMLKSRVSLDQVNELFKKMSDGQYKGILGVTNESLVSADVVGRRESAIVDLQLTRLISGKLLKVLVWYDNEWGYVNRLIDLCKVVSGKD